MQEIENYNCIDLCCEEHCSNHITNFQQIEVHGFKLILQFCEQHADKFERLMIEKSCIIKREQK